MILGTLFLRRNPYLWIGLWALTVIAVLVTIVTFFSEEFLRSYIESGNGLLPDLLVTSAERYGRDEAQNMAKIIEGAIGAEVVVPAFSLSVPGKFYWLREDIDAQGRTIRTWIPGIERSVHIFWLWTDDSPVVVALENEGKKTVKAKLRNFSSSGLLLDSPLPPGQWFLRGSQRIGPYISLPGDDFLEIDTTSNNLEGHLSFLYKIIGARMPFVNGFSFENVYVGGTHKGLRANFLKDANKLRYLIYGSVEDDNLAYGFVSSHIFDDLFFHSLNYRVVRFESNGLRPITFCVAGRFRSNFSADIGNNIVYLRAKDFSWIHNVNTFLIRGTFDDLIELKNVIKDLMPNAEVRSRTEILFPFMSKSKKVLASMVLIKAFLFVMIFVSFVVSLDHYIGTFQHECFTIRFFGGKWWQPVCVVFFIVLFVAIPTTFMIAKYFLFKLNQVLQDFFYPIFLFPWRVYVHSIVFCYGAILLSTFFPMMRMGRALKKYVSDNRNI